MSQEKAAKLRETFNFKLFMMHFECKFISSFYTSFSCSLLSEKEAG